MDRNELATRIKRVDKALEGLSLSEQEKVLRLLLDLIDAETEEERLPDPERAAAQP